MSTVISASLVKELRERTGAGMMECKKALEVSKGDLEGAIDELRKSGRTKADKKAGRVAAEGAIVILEEGSSAIMLEVNSETDFVARDTNFTAFVNAVAKTALKAKEEDVTRLSALPLVGSEPKTVEEMRLELVAKVGENVQLRRAKFIDAKSGTVGCYLHGNRIGVVVEIDADNKEVARDVAMHVAATKPLVIAPENVSAELVAKEKEIYMAQAATSGKPAEIVEKMVVGRLKKYLDEVSLVGQPFVKDPDVSVGALLNKNRAKVISFSRFEVGEGIEKVVEDFRETVMSQVKSS